MWGSGAACPLFPERRLKNGGEGVVGIEIAVGFDFISSIIRLYTSCSSKAAPPLVLGLQPWELISEHHLCALCPAFQSPFPDPDT